MIMTMITGVSAVCLFCLVMISMPLGGSTSTDNADTLSLVDNVDPLTKVADGNNKFALDLYRHLINSSEDNVLFSPLGVSSALAMTMLSLKKQHAAEELRKVLHLDEASSEEVHPSFRDLLDNLKDSAAAGNVLHVASRVFLKDGNDFLPEFTDNCRLFYDSDPERLNYSADAEGLRQHINYWVENKTDLIMQDFVRPGLFNVNTKSVLASAMNFKGTWESRFDDDLVKQTRFQMPDGETLHLDLMFQQGVFFTGFSESLGAQYLELPYAGGQLRMVLLLPTQRAGLSQLESKLEHLDFRLLHDDIAVNTSTSVLMPRFKMEASHNMKDILKALGAKHVHLTVQPDHAEYTYTQDISHILHRSALEVDKDGYDGPQPYTKGRQKNKIITSRPFMYYVQDVVSGALVFMGRVMDPRPIFTDIKQTKDEL